MNILAVDTAGKTAGVALLQDDRLLYEVYLDGGMTHSETLMPMIDTCLKMCGLTCADIDLSESISTNIVGRSGSTKASGFSGCTALRPFSVRSLVSCFSSIT